MSRGSGVNGIIWNAVAAKAVGISLGETSTFDDVLKECAVAKTKGKTLFGLAGSIPSNPGILAMEIATSTVYGSAPTWNTERDRGQGEVRHDAPAGPAALSRSRPCSRPAASRPAPRAPDSTR